jgi:hypothetical protein
MIVRVLVALLLQLLQLHSARSSVYLQASPNFGSHNISRQLLKYWRGV